MFSGSTGYAKVIGMIAGQPRSPTWGHAGAGTTWMKGRWGLESSHGRKSSITKAYGAWERRMWFHPVDEELWEAVLNFISGIAVSHRRVSTRGVGM